MVMQLVVPNLDSATLNQPYFVLSARLPWYAPNSCRNDRTLGLFLSSAYRVDSKEER
jgi:hypothetical protein